MMAELLIQNNITNEVYELSSLATEIELLSTITSQPTKLTIILLKAYDIKFSMGGIVSFKVNGKNIFYGYVFKVAEDSDKKIVITAYDQTIYLQNKDTYVFSNATASEMFKMICEDFKLKYRIVNESKFKLPSYIHDNKTLYEMIDYGVDQSLINEIKWYIIKDNFGVIEFLDVDKLKTNIIIGDESLATGFNYEESIIDNTFNKIKLVKDNKETQKRDVYIQQDSETISQWGILQYFEVVDENANPAQIKERAEKLLRLKNRVNKTLDVRCIGSLDVMAGNGIILDLKDFRKTNENGGYYIVEEVTHTWKQESHLMRLSLIVEE